MNLYCSPVKTNSLGFFESVTADDKYEEFTYDGAEVETFVIVIGFPVIFSAPVKLSLNDQFIFPYIGSKVVSGFGVPKPTSSKFTAWAVFVAIWVTVVYFPVAHWVFAFGNKVGDTVTGAGFLAARGVEDFAGGTAVHINAGAAGLAMAIILLT